VIPDPKVVIAALRAIRRVNDYALTIRFLEAIKIKCGSQKNRDVIYSHIVKEVSFFLLQGEEIFEVKPVLDELGIVTPEELGYDQPEFFIPQPEYWWERKWSVLLHIVHPFPSRYKEYGLDKLPGVQI